MAVACKTSMSARRDAGTSPDGRGANPAPDVAPDVAPDARSADAAPDVAPDAFATPDLPAGDLPLPDLAGPDVVPPDLAPLPSAPKSFRFDNHTDHPAYVVTRTAVGCRAQSSSGWQDCRFFTTECGVACASVSPGDTCCETCDEGLPSVLLVPSGESRTVAWNGNLYASRSGICSDCACEEATPIPLGAYQASANAYPDYWCQVSPCSIQSDGTIRGAYPQGTATTIVVPFSIPYAGEDIVFDITALAQPDAGVSPDLPVVDLAVASDPRSDDLPAAFADLPGNTFQIAAADTPPDASVPGADRCRPMDGVALYDLVFSADGTTVRIVRTDSVQEPVVSGTLTERSDVRLVYDLANLFAGGELVLTSESGNLVADLVVFGSGLPVIGCIESPMRKR
jgi:hypothetical protein